VTQSLKERFRFSLICRTSGTRGPLVRTSARLMRRPGGLNEADPVSIKELSRLPHLLSQLALRPARTRPERGTRHHRVLIPSLHVTAFRPSRFKARGGTCQFCRARPTLHGNLSLPCGDCPFWGPPQQNQRSRSTASAFDQTAKRLVRPLGYPPHLPVDSGVVRIIARSPLLPS
jgi:hypothetical protein